MSSPTYKPPQAAIEACAFAEGLRLGLTRAERLHRTRGEEALRVARLDANRLEAGGHKVSVQPFRKRAGFEADHVNLISPKQKLVDEWSGFAVHLSLPDELPVTVEHADGGFLKRDI